MVAIFWGLAIFTVTAIALGAYGKPRWYWWGALTAYLCSFLGGFSIGLYLLSITFVLIMLAAGHSLKQIRSFRHTAVAIAIGLGLWWLAVTWVDDVYLFMPFRFLTPWLISG